MYTSLHRHRWTFISMYICIGRHDLVAVFFSVSVSLHCTFVSVCALGVSAAVDFLASMSVCLFYAVSIKFRRAFAVLCLLPCHFRRAWVVAGALLVWRCLHAVGVASRLSQGLESLVRVLWLIRACMVGTGRDLRCPWLWVHVAAHWIAPGSAPKQQVAAQIRASRTLEMGRRQFLSLLTHHWSAASRRSVPIAVAAACLAAALLMAVVQLCRGGTVRGLSAGFSTSSQWYVV